MSPEAVTLLLVNVAAILERADESLLPGVYKEVGESLKIDPTGLGSLTLFRSLVQSLCYPLAVRHDRTHVIALGALLWAAATFLVAFSSTFLQVAVSRALNGIGLAIVIPSIQSLVADSTDGNNRGIAFGWLQLTGNMGAILGSICSVLVASTTFLGIPGWRIAFHFVGLLSVAISILVRMFATDPRFSNQTENTALEKSKTPFWSELKEVVQEAKSVVRIPSFQIIVAQGVAGTFPWAGMFSFAPMWLELIGFSHETTAFLFTMYVVGNSLGGLFGGKMGDVLSIKLPNCGRIMLSQISSASAVPLAAILFLGLSDDSSVAKYCLVMFIMGLTTSWNAPATNNPIFAEIVLEKHRTSIYALDCAFESILNSFGPPLVGILAQHVYEYKPAPKTSTDTTSTDRENGASLAKAINITFTVTMSVCCAIYSLLYCTYPRDRERARMQALVDSEMLKIEGIGDDDDDDPNVVTAESRGSNECHGYAESDEKRLLAL